jgi:3'-5' exoribonuclease
MRYAPLIFSSTLEPSVEPVRLDRLGLGQRFDEPLLVLEIEQRDASRGAFTILILGNRYGRLPTAPFWAEDLPRIAGIERGAAVQVSGEGASFNGKRQLKVATIRILPPESFDRKRLLPSVSDVRPYWETVDRWRGEIRGPRLRRTVDLFYAEPSFRARYEECPASTTGHHAELGGLLRHTCEVAAIGRAIARTCGADPDLVCAGALLHDIGKLEAYRWDRSFELTEAGALLGHVSLGLLMLDRHIAGAVPPPCTPQERLILLHLVGSHHGRQEYGATTPPMTLEAEALHFADNASAKTASMAEALRDPEHFAGEALLSSRSLWQLDRRRVYRGVSDWGESESTEQPDTAD